MKKSFWLELNNIFNENQELKETHQDLAKVISLFCSSMELQSQTDEIVKELQELNKEN